MSELAPITWLIDDLLVTISDSAPQELPSQHSKLIALTEALEHRKDEWYPKGGNGMTNFCIDLENEQAFVYEKTLESEYMQGRFGAIPRIQGGPRHRSQFFHTPMKIVEPSKLAEELRKFADKLERGDIS